MIKSQFIPNLSLISIFIFQSCTSPIQKTTVPSVVIKENQIAQTPPMGWNSYNCFGGNVTEDDVKANADYTIWTAKDKENGKTYMAVLNINDTDEKIVLPFEKAGVSKDVKVRDLWLKSDVAKLADGYEVELAPHGAKLFSLE